MNMRRLTLCIIGFELFFISSFAQSKKENRKPNVILVMTDDQGYGDLGCHGNPVLETPNLDQFHDESLRFTNFHAGTTSAPSRSMLMTGRDCNRVGVWHTVQGHSLLNEDEMTIADALKEVGYVTGIFGKWHLGDNYPYRPQERGFDEVLTFGGGGVGGIQDYWGNDYFDDYYQHNGVWEKYDGYCTDVWFAEAMKFIEKNKDKPFFCYIPTNAPHMPFYVPEKYKEMYVDKIPEEHRQTPLAEFYGMITNIDENFGKLRAFLQSLNLENNTILIFMTDNGSVETLHYYNAGMRGRKASEYDGGHRVPFFIRYPKGRFGEPRDIETLSGIVDVMPTLLGLCGVILNKDIDFDGQSLVPLLKKEKNTLQDRIMFADRQRREHPKRWNASSVLKGNYRLVNENELYDVTNDVGQQHNIIADHLDLVEELTEAYDTYWTGLKLSLEKVNYIKVGTPNENPTWLSSHDEHGSLIWLQSQLIMGGGMADGYWCVDFVEDGEYEITLTNSSPFSDGTNKVPINASLQFFKWHNLKNQTAYNLVEGADYARLKLFDIDVDQLFAPEDTETTFTLNIKKGKTRIQGWFVNGEREAVWGPYFIGIKKIDNN